jgi:hypothetical protein
MLNAGYLILDAGSIEHIVRQKMRISTASIQYLECTIQYLAPGRNDMAFRGSVWRVVKGSGVWLYCWLRIFVHWLVKVGGNRAIRFRAWLHKSSRKKSTVKLGEAVYQLRSEGKTDWFNDVRVKEIIQELEGSDRRRDSWEKRLQEREARYREQVKRLREVKGSQLTESEGEGEAGSGQQAAGNE